MQVDILFWYIKILYHQIIYYLEDSQLQLTMLYNIG